MVDNISETFQFIKANMLFVGFSDSQLAELLSIMEMKEYRRDQTIIQENEINDLIYIIYKGRVEVKKYDSELNKSINITTLGSGEVLGEMSLLDNSPRSASVISTQHTKIIVFSLSRLRKLSEREKLAQSSGIVKEGIQINSLPALQLLMQNLTLTLTSRVRRANELVVAALRNELNNEKSRSAMGFLIIATIISLLMFIGILKYTDVEALYFTTNMATIPAMIIFFVIIISLLRQTRHPLEFYGITLKNWRGSLKDAVTFTSVLISVVILFKWALIKTVPHFAGMRLFEFKVLSNPSYSLIHYLADIMVYIIIVPFQELFVRGALQSSFQEFLKGPNRIPLAIILSNLIYVIIQLNVSLLVIFGEFLPGLFWGWMYARNKTLLGPCISHIVFGIVFFDFIGF